LLLFCCNLEPDTVCADSTDVWYAIQSINGGWGPYFPELTQNSVGLCFIDFSRFRVNFGVSPFKRPAAAMVSCWLTASSVWWNDLVAGSCKRCAAASAPKLRAEKRLRQRSQRCFIFKLKMSARREQNPEDRIGSGKALYRSCARLCGVENRGAFILAEVLRPTWNLLLALVCVRWRKGWGGEGGFSPQQVNPTQKLTIKRGLRESHIRSVHCIMLTYMKQSGGENWLWQCGDGGCTAVVAHATHVCEPSEEVE
jgi:hypothetical protein